MKPTWRWALTIILSIVGLVLFNRAVVDRWQNLAGPQSYLVYNESDPRQVVQFAWEQMRQSGQYDFSADLQQTISPLATLENAGRGSSRQSYYLEGANNLPARQMHFTIWTDGGNVLDPSTGNEMRVDGDKVYTRKGDNPWQETSGITDLFAPGGDFMAFLAGAKNIQESRDASGLRHFTFDLDGPSFANYMRNDYQQRLEQSGKLPAGMQIQVSQQFANLSGQGELWLNAAGLPLRQVLNLHFPPSAKEQVSAVLTVNYSNIVAPGITPLASFIRHSEANLPRLLQSAAFVLVMCLAMGLALNRKPVYAALVGVTIFSMLAGPLEQSARAASLGREQQAQAVAQKAQRQEVDERQLVEQKLTTPDIAPNISPLETAQNKAALGLQTAAAENTAAVNKAAGIPSLPLKAVQAPSSKAPLLEGNAESTVQCKTVFDNPSIDTDKDGLADCQEKFLGTDATIADTDGDAITDTIEVKGFVLACNPNKTWYGDPLQKDTNKDGLPDTVEWNKDTDQDCNPDLWSRDNDGDGVPDKLDLSPFEARLKPFTSTQPLEFVINDLTEGLTTTLELQIRPVVTDHLQYAFNVFAWPKTDGQGQMIDLDGKTFKDVHPDSDNPQDALGNVRIVPMLEFRMSGKSNNLPSPETLNMYGVAVHKLEESGENLAAYVPISLITDQGDTRVAFAAKMPYLAGAAWGSAQQVRMVWMAVAMTEVCKKDGWVAGACPPENVEKWNEDTLLVMYQDDFVITGMRIREDHSAQVAIVYKDPQQLSGKDIPGQINRLKPTNTLVYGLERSFLAGRTITDTNGVQKFDLPIEEIQRRFDHTINANVPISPTRFNIQQNVFRVNLYNYSSIDQAMYTIAATETKKILNNVYTSYWSASEPITPTLLFARQERSRTLGMDEVASGYKNISWDGNKLTLRMPANTPTGSDLEAIPLATTATLSWASYRFSQNAWSACPPSEFLNALDLIYPPDQFNPDPVTAAGEMALIKALYAALYQGIGTQIATNDIPEPAPFQKIDIDIAEAIELILERFEQFHEPIEIIAELLVEWIMVRFEEGTWKAFFHVDTVHEIAHHIGQALDAAHQLPHDVQEFLGKVFRKLEIIGKATFIVVAIITLIWLIINIIAIALHWHIPKVVVFIMSLVFLLFTFIMAVIAIIKIIVALVKAGSAGSAWKILKQAEEGAKITIIVTLIMMAVIILIGLLTIACNSDIKWGSVEASAIGAQILAALIVLIIYTVLAMIPVVGEILVFILALIDFLLGWLTDRDLAGWLAEVLFSVDQIVELETDTRDVHLGFDHPELGFTAGNSVNWSFVMTSTAENVEPKSYLLEWAIAYGKKPYLTNDIRKTNINWELNHEEHEIGPRNDGMPWAPTRVIGNYDDNDLYATWITQSLYTNQIELSEAGVNVTVTAYLNNNYSIPVEECWFAILAAVCVNKHADGHKSDEVTVGAFDIFPATLDEFYAWNWGKSWHKEGGKLELPKRCDADNDGLLSQACGGLDPDDSKWDIDGDTLSDDYEMRMNSKPPSEGGGRFNWLKADTDEDGLRDDVEARLGSDPANPDSDFDGLSDLQEITGYSFVYGADNLSYPALSSPTHPDGDRDGISDYSEYVLYRQNPTKNPYKPDAWNENPLALRLQLETINGYLAPGFEAPVTLNITNVANTPVFMTGQVVITAGNNLPYQGSYLNWKESFELGVGNYLKKLNTVKVKEDAPTQQTQLTADTCAALKAPTIYLPLDEVQGAQTFANSSATTYNAVCSAGSCPAAGETGVSGKAVRFTGSQELLIQDTPDDGFYFPTFSFAAWVKADPAAAGTIFAKQTSKEIYRLDYDGLGAAPRLKFNLEDKNSTPAKTIAIELCPARQAELKWNAGGWNSLIVQRSNEKADLYINGVLAQKNNCGAAAQPEVMASPEGAMAGSTVSLGNGPGGHYQGYLDDVYFLDRTLTPAEVEQLGKLPTVLSSLEANRGCDLTPRQIAPVTIDADVPTSTITTLKNNQYLLAPDVYVIGGLALDPTSPITKVEISIDGTDWKPVSGTGVWSYAWNVVRTGRHTLRTRATDTVGHPEDPKNEIAVYIDRTAPDVIFKAEPMYAANLNADGDWAITISGQAADMCAGVKSVEVRLEGQGKQPGNGWQEAALQGQSTHACLAAQQAAEELAPSGSDLLPWTINYVLGSSHAFDYTGVYTISIRAADNLDNITRPSVYVQDIIQLDNTPPKAWLDESSLLMVPITTPLTLRGVISDPGPVASGVDALEAAWMPAETMDLLQSANLLMHLDEPAGMQAYDDDTHNWNSAACMTTPCPEAGKAGRIDTALQFNGRNMAAAVANMSPVQLTGTLSLATWFKTSAATIGFQTLAGKWTLTGEDGAYALYWQPGSGLAFGVQNATHQRAEAASKALYNDGQWHHAVGIYDGSQVQLYVDGRLVAWQAAPAIGTLNNAAMPFMLGANYPANPDKPSVNYYDGLLDEIVLFPYALQSDQVKRLYEAAQITWQPAVVAQRAAPYSPWSLEVPTGLEGHLQLSLRTTDMIGNRNARGDLATRNTWNAWRGEVDTLAPRLSITNIYTGTLSQITCKAEDLNLGVQGFECPCPWHGYDRTTYDQVSDWYRRLTGDTSRLYALQPSCVIPRQAGKTYTAKACDRYGRCSTAQVSGMALVPDSAVPAGPEAAGPLAIVVIPTDRAVLPSLDPLTLTVAGQAPAYLKTITVSLDGAVQQVFNFPAGTVTETLSEAWWTPPAGLSDGPHTWTASAEDWNGGTQALPTATTLFVDTDVPTVDISPLVITTALMTADQFATLGGVAVDQGGVQQVEFAVDGGPWQVAAADGGRWRGQWIPPTLPNGQVVNVQVRMSDLAGRSAQAMTDVTIDFVAPPPVEVQIAYTNSQGQVTTVLPGSTIRDIANPTLTVSWKPQAADLGASAKLYYLGGLTENPTPQIELMTAYPSGTASFTSAAQEAHVYYAHVAAADGRGNLAWSTVGPVYADTPQTPDYAPLVSDNIGYRSWMDSGCSLVGTNRAVFDTSSAFQVNNDLQHLYLTWDDQGLHLTWSGARWSGVSNLFIYMNTGLTPGTTEAIAPPGSEPSLVSLPVAMNWLVWVDTDLTAHLLYWDGIQWLPPLIGLESKHIFRFTHWQDADYSDLYLPFDILNITDPASTALDLVAFASDSDSTASGLQLWAVMPPVNPLNSSTLGPSGGTPTAGLSMDLKLWNAFHWDSLGGGQCPGAGYGDYDLRVIMDVEPKGELTQTRPGGIYWANPIFSGQAQQPVGGGQTLTYTLSISNVGQAAAPDAWLRLKPTGALLLDGSTDIQIGPIQPDELRQVTIVGQVIPGVDQAADLLVEVYGLNPAQSSPVDSFGASNPVDTEPPDSLVVFASTGHPGETNYVRPALVPLVVAAHDNSGVAQVELEKRDPQGNVSSQDCPISGSQNGQWACAVDFSGSSSGQVFSLRIRATDVIGQQSEWSAWFDFVIDDQPPSVSLDTDSETDLADHIVTGSGLAISGQVNDDRQVSQVEICLGPIKLQYGFRIYMPFVAQRGVLNRQAKSAPAVPAASMASTVAQWDCQTYDLIAENNQRGRWHYTLPNPLGIDGAEQDLLIYGLDAAGNRTTQPLAHTYRLDGQAPALQVNTYLASVSLAAYHSSPTPLLVGSTYDGSGQPLMAFTIITPANGIINSTLPAGSRVWRFTPALEQTGVHRIYLRAYDPAGNVTFAGPYEVEVQP